jgi:hypothetical protein
LLALNKKYRYALGCCVEEKRPTERQVPSLVDLTTNQAKKLLSLEDFLAADVIGAVLEAKDARIANFVWELANIREGVVKMFYTNINARDLDWRKQANGFAKKFLGLCARWKVLKQEFQAISTCILEKSFCMYTNVCGDGLKMKTHQTTSKSGWKKPSRC